jgi:hypothetical protein
VFDGSIYINNSYDVIVLRVCKILFVCLWCWICQANCYRFVGNNKAADVIILLMFCLLYECTWVRSPLFLLYMHLLHKYHTTIRFYPLITLFPYISLKSTDLVDIAYKNQWFLSSVSAANLRFLFWHNVFLAPKVLLIIPYVAFSLGHWRTTDSKEGWHSWGFEV